MITAWRSSEDTARLLPVAYVVGGLILISGVVLILADLIDPIRLF